jgi:hypothetical protein
MQQIDNIPLSPIKIPKETNDQYEKKETFFTSIISLFIRCFDKPKEDD